MSKRILMVVGLCSSVILLSCGGKSGGQVTVRDRVLASQGVSATLAFGALFVVNGQNDTLPRVSPLSAGNSPGLIVVSPTRNIAATFDSSSNSVFAVNTSKQTSIGSVHLPGPTSSLSVPTADPTVYAAVPTATVNGFAFLGAVEVLNFAANSFTTIAASNAQTVVSNSQGTELLVFSPDSDAITVLFPGAAVPPVDTSCYTNPPNQVCTIVQDSRLSRPVNAIISGTTAYILNCGFACGGTLPNGNPAPASVAVFDLGSLAVTQTVTVDAATMALLSGSTLYVAGTPVNFPCPASQKTAATDCGTLDVVDLSSMQVTSATAITDGYHDRMDLTTNGQIFVGSRNCTNIGNVNNPTGGEIRGCLSIYNIANGSVIFPPDNGDVTGLQGFTTRYVEYVAEGGQLRVYDTKKDILLINDFLPLGTIDIVGYVGDVKAIDFF
ncbi:MAG TPA: hypothetical protein VJP02_13555 [Candidatus Sulfotelmatobacter sp.]|nr:hypothetical protein [Candidatus Sulfotelmatobacter sp.]